MNQLNTQQSKATQNDTITIKPIHFAKLLKKISDDMKKDGIDCTLERHDSTGIHLIVYGVTIGDDGKFEEVDNDKATN